MLLTIRSKLISAIITLLALLSLIAAVGLYYVFDLEKNLRHLSEDITPTIENTDDMIASLWEQGKVANEIMASEDIDEIRQLYLTIEPLNQTFNNSYQELTHLLDEQELIAAQQAFDANTRLQGQINDMFLAHKQELDEKLKAKSLLQSFDDLGAVLIGALDEFAIENEEEMAKAENKGDTLAKSPQATAQDVNAILGELFERDYPVVEAALKMQRYVMEMQDTAGEYLAEEDPALLAAIRENFDELSRLVVENINILDELAESEEDSQDAKDLRTNFVLWQQLALTDGQLFDSYRIQLQAEAKADAFTDALEASITQADALLENLASTADSLADSADDEAATAVNTAVVTVALVWLLALVTGVVITYTLIKVIINPIDLLVTRLNGIAKGDGDLTQRIDDSGGDELAALGKGFNEFVAKIQQLVKQISSESVNLDHAIDSMSNISRKVSERVGFQSQEVSQVVSYIEQVHHAADSIFDNAQHCSHASHDATQDSEAVRSTVQQAIVSVEGLAVNIDESSRVIDELSAEVNNIVSVLDVIRSIAEQTNLLALNAAIEAARAGEQGRGFAVVADEVRTLASRTQNSTNEIQSMIESLKKGASEAVVSMVRSKEGGDQTVKLANQAGSALDRISDAIAGLNQMNAQIATAAENQRSVVGSATQSVAKVQTVVDESLVASTENQGYTQNMGGSVLRLNSLVKQFKVE
ncbi:methyl-accepting chemotaxis protein [Shewanella sp. NIFS-20-20]|uniref:methyl-accepting chemotaxis protein n=1 Tax=Shewanella sp. NIFS-20-20 TaxID=2853806 RepID=UPI001C44FA51|nr:methyl-accepting chemotaxis protein [Shewanella sp. NIFS-20-20]MBV7317431.1 methyl-accepting chemotaxis protein [Shewanella sp. NIFS-20-20]